MTSFREDLPYKTPRASDNTTWSYRPVPLFRWPRIQLLLPPARPPNIGTTTQLLRVVISRLSTMKHPHPCICRIQSSLQAALRET